MAGCAGTVLLAGCSSDEPAPEEDPPPTVRHPRAPLPNDRDGQVVLAALRGIDPCALLDPSGGTVPGVPADRKPQAAGPFSCTIERDGGGAVSVEIGTFTIKDKVSAAATTLGGAKAYVVDKSSDCTVALPVSFELAVKFSLATRPDRCLPPQGFAQVAATKLANPDSVATTVSWDACTALSMATEGRAGRYTPWVRGIESCESGSEGSLKLSYGSNSQVPREPGTVGDRQVDIRDDSECEVAWRHGSARTSNELWATVLLRDCDRAKALAERVMKVLDSTPPAVAPQRPVLYRPDEPDMAVAGACAFTVEYDKCQPFVDVPVPAGAEQVVRAAYGDPNVDCALAIEAVAKHFGAQWKPVTIEGLGCRFLEATRSVYIGISVLPGPLEERDGERDTTLAGHPGRVQVGRGYSGIVASLDKDGDVDGTLFVSASAESNQSKVEAVAADILGKHFN